MIRKLLIALSTVLAIQGTLLAQGPSAPNGFDYNMGNYNQENYLKGWYLYWPAEALLQPRRPMPFPWWPTHGNAAIPAFSGSGPDEMVAPAPQAPGQLNLPAANPPLPGIQPAVPSNKTSYYPGYRPIQPVSYPQNTPGYWYGRR